MDTFCFDKTGTLTVHRLRLVGISDADMTIRTVDEAAVGVPGAPLIRQTRHRALTTYLGSVTA